MDQILADKSLEQAKTLIQTHVTSDLLSAETKQIFIDLYKSLTVENAQEVYLKTSQLYGNAARAYDHAFNMSMLTLAAYVIALGLFLAVIGYIGDKLAERKVHTNKPKE